MRQPKPGPVEKAFRDGQVIDEAIRRAAAAAKARHWREGYPIIVASNGTIREIPPPR